MTLKDEYGFRATCLSLADSPEYRAHLISRLNDTPQNIFELMDGFIMWESSLACHSLMALIESGKAVEHHRVGNFFQHRYFIKGLDK